MPIPANFLPSHNGFAFTNSWPSEPDVVLPTPFGQIDIGNADARLCGGMVFAALDYWYAGIVPRRPGRPRENRCIATWSSALSTPGISRPA
jgi:hypothetical protein